MRSFCNVSLNFLIGKLYFLFKRLSKYNMIIQFTKLRSSSNILSFNLFCYPFPYIYCTIIRFSLIIKEINPRKVSIVLIRLSII